MVAEDIDASKYRFRLVRRVETKRMSRDARDAHRARAIRKHERPGARERKAGCGVLDRLVGRARPGGRRRHDDLGQQLLWKERSEERSLEKVLGWNGTLAFGGPKHEGGPEGNRQRGQIRRGVRVREASADRPSISYLEISDSCGALGDGCKRGSSQLGRLDELVPYGKRPDTELTVAELHAAQLEPADVDE